MNVRQLILLAITSTVFLIESCKDRPVTEPKDAYNLSVIILNDTLVYYNGTEDEKASFTQLLFDKERLNQLFILNKKKYGDSLHIILKFTSSMEKFQQPVEVLDVTMQYDSSYSIEKLNTWDKKWLHTTDFIGEPPKPVEVTPPVVTTKIVSKSGFYILLKKDQSIWYQEGNTTEPVKIDKQKPGILEKAIADYKERCEKGNKPAQFFIKGDNSTNYKDFELAVNALKKNKEYKYNLITAAE
jgi:biopolymer transport protein ExbD